MLVRRRFLRVVTEHRTTFEERGVDGRGQACTGLTSVTVVELGESISDSSGSGPGVAQRSGSTLRRLFGVLLQACRDIMQMFRGEPLAPVVAQKPLPALAPPASSREEKLP